MAEASGGSSNHVSTISNTNTEFDRNFESVLDQRINSNYCRIKSCSTIICSSNPESSDAGAVASDYIETIFKAECKNTKSVKLSFDSCTFTENALRKNWLRTNLSIEELTLDSCSLREIEDDVFALSIFEATKRIVLTNNKFTSLRKAVFRHLTTLEELSIRDNIVSQAEFNLLETVANSLVILELNRAINDTEVLRNILGGGTLSKVQILSLRRNTIPVISHELFVGVPAVVSLYLEDSRIKTVSRRAFDPIAYSIEQLFITGNMITSLPTGLFDSILRAKRNFRMAIHNNPWNCECNLKWLQDLKTNSPSIFNEDLYCSTPEMNAGKSFNRAEFCPSDSTIPTTLVENSSTASTNHNPEHPTTTEISATTGTVASPVIAINCSFAKSYIQKSLLSTTSRKLLSTDVQLPSRLTDFFVLKTTDRYILINLPNLDKAAKLFWFNNDDVEGSVSCAKNIRHAYLVQNIDQQTTYTICLLRDNEDTVSPLNCLAVTTGSAYESRTWLTNSDKAEAISLLAVSFALLFLVGVVVTYLVIMKYPSLLRCSKRVMLVKKNNVDAIVLPKGVHVDRKERRFGTVTPANNKFEDGYITPLPPVPVPLPRVSRISRVSLQSDLNSYVSELEATETQLASWRLTRLNSELEKQKSDAPPLPPHPSNEIQSLSLAVESKDENLEYDI
ncbi:PREDICTED: leucine-rich repeat transmembrane protein FLRT1-like [Dufourea novaeangliae]|uniref:leucine-rich repeat transmembrane protein FLRT1-like n=1 Tax=Dufourea novaeangliae TaxID=178035 RepID=UPI000767C784|nr:PREDICTED: leucine-rich repeat transmembrane protein FLRT1-like [Dufourea novaeangliae]